ncbi:helix-turn-helix domain-containing protein [Marinimicrobium sp. ABcell2]|uniref:winged helix-turn-helix transcriptional regulator n=1 Tax=Marinimicrobium sp. ABcell2 TaxID=3069751 RepID=UPI0027B4422A|nr:helix-turn-helix domain-containing protein [Marinimicrobium sp. ABcell2]MDQ2075828.1 helix-turn-helix domain-containing protein [Marinimicrobium sp. ABcell2]
MQNYGQFCPLALASEIIGERWTPLILREVVLGARRFNHIHRGVPRISPALLSKRLSTLQAAGIVERQGEGGHGEYQLTEAGLELAPVIENLARWGKRWLPATLSENRADPDLIVWDMRRRMKLEKLPRERTVVEFLFIDQVAAKQRRWLVGNRLGMELCITDPGFDVDLVVKTDSRTITWVWFGDLPLLQAIGERKLLLQGAPHLCDAFPSWLQLSPTADITRKKTVPLL